MKVSIPERNLEFVQSLGPLGPFPKNKKKKQGLEGQGALPRVFPEFLPESSSCMAKGAGGKVGFGKRGSFGKGAFSEKSMFVRDSREFRDFLEFPEIPHRLWKTKENPTIF